jgi:hypothetical protein
MSKLLHTEQQLLRDFVICAEQLFNGETIYHVGSSVSADKRTTHRDVDLRVMLEPKTFKQLAKIVNIDRLNLAISLYGQKVTGMPIDFQVQDQDYANEHHSMKKQKKYRSAIRTSIAKGDGHP